MGILGWITLSSVEVPEELMDELGGGLPEEEVLNKYGERVLKSVMSSCVIDDNEEGETVMRLRVPGDSEPDYPLNSISNK